jgi:hypothetical protein
MRFKRSRRVSFVEFSLRAVPALAGCESLSAGYSFSALNHLHASAELIADAVGRAAHAEAPSSKARVTLGFANSIRFRIDLA